MARRPRNRVGELDDAVVAIRRRHALAVLRLEGSEHRLPLPAWRLRVAGTGTGSATDVARVGAGFGVLAA
jgi:hypothetical protein